MIHFGDEPDGRKGQGKGFGPAGGEDRHRLEYYQHAKDLLGVVAYEVEGPP